MLRLGKQSRQRPGRVHFLPWQQVGPTTVVGLQALEESIAQEKDRAQEALGKVQARVRELENHLACQKEVRAAWGGWLEVRAWGRYPVLFVLAWALELGDA